MMSDLWSVEWMIKNIWSGSSGFPVLDIRPKLVGRVGGLPRPWHSQVTSASVGQVEPLKKRKKYFHFGPKPFQSACVCGKHFNHTNHMVLCENIHMNIKMILKFGLTSRPTVPKPAWGAALPLTLLHQVWSWHYCTWSLSLRCQQPHHSRSSPGKGGAHQKLSLLGFDQTICLTPFPYVALFPIPYLESLPQIIVQFTNLNWSDSQYLTWSKQTSLKNAEKGLL